MRRKPAMGKAAAKRAAFSGSFTPRQIVAWLSEMEPTDEPTSLNPAITRAGFRQMFLRAFAKLPQDEPIEVERYNGFKGRMITSVAGMSLINVFREIGPPPQAKEAPDA